MSQTSNEHTENQTALIEKLLLEATNDNHNLMVPWYLMLSYAYYVEDDPLVSDGVYDRLARRMAEHWDTIEHIHKDVIKIDDLKAGSFLGTYPSRLPDAVKSLRRTVNNEK